VGGLRVWLERSALRDRAASLAGRVSAGMDADVCPPALDWARVDGEYSSLQPRDPSLLRAPPALVVRRRDGLGVRHSSVHIAGTVAIVWASEPADGVGGGGADADRGVDGHRVQEVLAVYAYDLATGDVVGVCRGTEETAQSEVPNVVVCGDRIVSWGLSASTLAAVRPSTAARSLAVLATPSVCGPVPTLAVAASLGSVGPGSVGHSMASSMPDLESLGGGAGTTSVDDVPTHDVATGDHRTAMAAAGGANVARLATSTARSLAAARGTRDERIASRRQQMLATLGVV